MTTDITVKGLTGRVSFDGRSIILEHMSGGAKTVPVRMVGAVQFRPAGLVTDGLWSVSVQGEVQSSRFRSTMREALNENAVVVRGRKRNADFQALTDAVNAAMAAL